MKLSSIDFKTYEKAVKSVGSLSRLFSDSSSPYLSPKFVEKLFVLTSGSRDLATIDISFDAMTQASAGVGVKTFTASNFQSEKSEKVAEFTAHASSGEFEGLPDDEIAYKVAEFRNARVNSDAKAFDIDLDSSFYHCLVRSSGSCMVHEEPYHLIDLSRFKMVKGSRAGGNPHFTDGQHKYSFSKAKNTLYRKFEIGKYSNSETIEVKFLEDVFELLVAGQLDLKAGLFASAEQPTNSDFLVLPLYSSNGRVVKPKSGINQWNAGGRKRSFGEAYIPRPVEIANRFPDFFPPKDTSFTLRLPTGEEMSAKVCQENGKAVMSNPNTSLMNWLYIQIDDTPEMSLARYNDKRPYTMRDLVRVGKDSVKFTCVDRQNLIYELTPMPLGSYERFLAGDLDSESDFNFEIDV